MNGKKSDSDKNANETSVSPESNKKKIPKKIQIGDARKLSESKQKNDVRRKTNESLPKTSFTRRSFRLSQPRNSKNNTRESVTLKKFKPLNTIPKICDFELIFPAANATPFVNISAEKRKHIQKLLVLKAKEAKERDYREPLEPYKPKVPSLNNSHQQMRKFAESLPWFYMDNCFEQCIHTKLGNNPKLKNYMHLIPDIFVEVNNEFYGTPMHDATVDSKVIPVDRHETHIKLNCYKYNGRTKNYRKFLQIRSELKLRLFITRPLLRKLLMHTVVGLPMCNFDFDDLRTPLGLLIEEVKIIVKRKSLKMALFLEGEWYKNIVKFVTEEESLIIHEYVNNYFASASGLICLYVSQMIRTKIEEFVDRIQDDYKTPYLRLEMYHDYELKLKPDMKTIEASYTDIIMNIFKIAQYLHTVEYLCIPGVPVRYIKLDIPPTFIESMSQKINENLTNLYKPLTDYMNLIKVTYWPLYDLTTQAQQINEEDLNFERGCELISFYNQFIVQLRDLYPIIYFNFAIVDQRKVIEHLKQSAELVKAALAARMMNLLNVENKDICLMFDFIKMRAETVPKSTAELMELYTYMVWASVEHMAYLQGRVQNAINNMITLMNIALVKPDCIKRLTITVNWIFKSKEILEKNASMLERVKFEFEEALQKVVENLNSGVRDMMPYLKILNRMDDSDKARDYLIYLRGTLRKIREFDEMQIWINKEEALFKFPLSTYTELDELKKFIYPFFKLINICNRWRRYYEVWMDGPFENLEFEKAEATVDEIYKDLQRISKNYRSKIKQQAAEDTPRKFTGLVDDPDPLNLPAPIKLCNKTMDYIRNFRPLLQVIQIFCSPALYQRHWDEMSEIAGFDMTPDAGTTLRKMVNRGFGNNLDQFEIISSGAVKERQLWLALQKMLAEWDEIRFKVGFYKETKIAILTALDDIQAILEEHIIKTLTIRGSVFVKHFEGVVKTWYEKIVRMNNTIEEWGKVQSQWLYLLPIFSSKDIIAQMPEEGVLFKQVDNTYRRYMQAVQKDNLVTGTAGAVGMLEAMQECTELLDKINEGVCNYLEKKRLFFARFFFLSNDEMLEILSETKDPLRVQPHLRKCFEGINKLEFNENLEILAMYSKESEKIDFTRMINTEEAHGSVEKWLIQVEEQMVMSVRNEIINSLEDYKKSHRTTWVQIWPGQVVLAVSQIYWTINVHACLREEPMRSLNDLYLELVDQLQDIVTLIRSPKLTNLIRITIKALIVLDVHAKDVVKDLVDKKVRYDTEFKWLAQLRYYWEGECLVRMINATVKYAYEYLGNSDRLVITPLTDRCYRTLVGAYHLHLNGAPEGPAGTGKTETTKDLAKAIAVQCVVFNCSDGLDYKAMGKFFKGLASSGAWACFDEFNRIELEVLSVVAQQILSIVLAVRANLTKFVFEGTELVLNPAVYICITMNPGYAGRSELPDNLKVLFRTVAMMVPDYAMIGEISLYSYGFSDARTLSVKIVTTYRLCSEQLSSQNHYDYGMRAVKTVLSACGNIKRKFPDENEDILLLRSLIDVNLPKFLSFDVPLFEGIISDLFPGIILPTLDYSDLIKASNESCKERNIQPREIFITKIIQTYEMMIVRHGFMLVGDPFSGKTSTLKVLADALTKMSQRNLPQVPVHYEFINPKSITMGQLYGQFDQISYEWFDGVVATIYRRFAMDERPDRNWVIFDGPVDAVWIENMNTVLDDNKKLCLTSGEVIQMTNSMSMIFEVMDLAQASPATVSRCGMIYMESLNLGWRPFFESWLNNLNPEWGEPIRKDLITIFDWVIPPCFQFIKKNCKQFVYPGDINLIMSTMTLVEIYMNEACEEFKDESRVLVAWAQGTMMVCLMWGLGGILDEISRIKFDEFTKDLWRGLNEEYPIPEDFKIEIPVPTEAPLFEYIYIYKTAKGSWKNYAEILKKQRINENASINNLLVPTLDTCRYMYNVKKLIKCNKPVLLVGPTGTGKSFYIQDLLMNNLDQELYEPAFLTFTAQTQANQTQDIIISKLVKGRGGNFSAPKGKTTIMFIDDMNMPAKEIYGAQPPIELLRQYFDHGNWYNLKTTSKIFLHNILILAAMGLVGGSRQDVYARFLRHFTIFSINNFSDESMVKIFSMVLLTALKKNGFATEVMTNVQCVVHATLDLYKAANAELLPTPAKSHYVFNLRDFSRVIQGCGLLRKESADTNKKIFPKLWVHESLRIFYDRLIEDTDKNWLYDRLRIGITNYFKENFDMVFETMRNSDGVVTEEILQELMFGMYLDLDAPEDEKKYEEIESMEIFLDIAMSALEEYNATHKTKMDIVLFRYALMHLSKLCRIIAMPKGSALLVGIGGSGRQSLTRLGAALFQYNVFQPEITKNYGLNEFRDDIKLVLKEAGGLGKHSIFLFTEDQLKEESFLQDIDSLLNSGEVPNLFAIDEKQEILEMVRLAAQGGNRNLDVSPLAVFSFFINRCKEKLHIALCFSPIGAAFRKRIRLYPSLVNCCTIDWYQDWPENALEMVAHHWMKELNVENEIKEKAIITCKYFHVEARKISANFFQQYGRRTYITSASYLDLIISYQLLANKKQQELKMAKFRYISGLEKLDFAAEQVTDMQIALEELQPKLKEMTEKATVMLKQIEYETIQVENASRLVRKDEEIANSQAAEAQTLKAECEADLAQAIPILEEAIDALNTLKPTDITLVKSMKNPPAAVKLVMAAVCVMRDVKPDRTPDPQTGKMIIDFWGPSKRILGDMNFLQQLKDFDKDHIPIATMIKIRKEYLPHKDFKPHIVAKASSAAEGLCKWIIAMDLYDKVAREVAPKKEKLEKAEAEFNATMAILQAKRDEVARLEAKLADLNVQLDEAQAEAKRLQDAVNLCSEKLGRARKLIDGLGGEKYRWIAAAENLQEQYDSLPGDMLISCGIIAYLAPFVMQIRLHAIDDWCRVCKEQEIPCSENYDFCKVLGSDITIQEWYINSLPRDAFSTQNAIIQNTSKRWSLLIDPQNQANKWIKTLEKVNHLHTVKFSDANYMKMIENCITNGWPVLVENIGETLEAPLDPLLNKKTFKQGGVLVISLGDNVLTYHQNFRLYLTSKLRNPHYMPEVFNKVTIINFALTEEGLEDQLLGIVVANERPDLQRQKEQLVVESAENRSALKLVEDMILKTLSETEGNILEDEAAIQILDSSKAIAADIIQKQTIAKKTEGAIEIFRQAYRPVAAYSTVLYYSISDLPNVDPMYQYSLNWFIGLFRSSVLNSTKSNVLKKRIECIIDVFTFNLYSNVCRSLFEKDKLLYSFVLCTKIMMYKKELGKDQYLFFLTGGIPVENPIENPAPTWLPTKSWDEICRLSDLPSFSNFATSFAEDSFGWHRIHDHIQPHQAIFPSPWNTDLSDFEKLMIIKIIRADKLLICMYQFIERKLGSQYVSPPPFDLFKSYADSNNLCPLIFILSPGADPIMALNKFAERKGFNSKFQSISLGQGQGPIAEELIINAMGEGHWVCLQNCHLALSWMSRLEKLCEMLDDRNTHDAFRLWLTSYPSDKFPVSILQNGVKITNEPPTGLHQNLRLSFISDPIKDPNFFYSLHGKENWFSKFLYAICFFHAVVQERRSFGPLGWNIPYGFNDSDLHISIQQLQMFLGEYEDIPYEALLYSIGECNYGGRVTDDWDRRLITTILNDFIHPNVINDKSYLFTDVDKCYGLPEKISYEDYLEFIDGLPDFHPPEVFGLHKNAGITRDLQNTNLMLASLLLVEGEMRAGGGSTDEVLNLLIHEILSKLPENFDLDKAKEKYPVDYKESMNTVLVQELERFNKLLTVIRASLNTLRQAVSGLVAMTPDLEHLSNSLLLSRIPAAWAKVSYPSLKSLSDYISDFLIRIDFLQKWYDEGKPPSFWISGFFFTQAFLTGAKQNYARKYTIPIDQLDFDHQIIPHADYIETPAPEGIFIYGLFVDGARYDRDEDNLAEQKPKILWDILPIIWLKPILIVDFREMGRYRSPVYKTSERKGILSTTGHSTNYVLPVYLKTKIKPSHWVKRSVALLCQLD